MSSVNAPVVSFIVPVYNGEESLGRSLDSIAAQTLTDWETIIVDDGSEDDSAARAEAYSARDPRFRLISQDNAGASAARNAALAAAKGRFVVFVDADDWIAPEHLETLLPMVMDRDDKHLAYCSYVRVTSDDVPMPPDWCPRLMVDPFELLAQACEPAIHCVVVSRAAVAAVGNYDEDLATCEDWDLWQRLARAGVKFHGTEKPLAFYRMRDGSLSTRYEHVERDAQIVLRRGASADPRVPDPLPQYANGSQAAAAMLAVDDMLAKAGGEAALGKPHDGSMVADKTMDADFDCRRAIDSFISGFANARNVTDEELCSIATDVNAALVNGSTPKPAANAIIATIAEICLERDELIRPIAFGGWMARKIDLEKPLEPIIPAPGADRLFLKVTLGEELLGTLTLPIFGTVSPTMIADAAVDRLSIKEMARNRKLMMRAGSIVGTFAGGWKLASDVLSRRVIGRHGLKRTKAGLAREMATAAVRRALAGTSGRNNDGGAKAAALADKFEQTAAQSVPAIANAGIAQSEDEPDMNDGRKEYWEQIFAEPDPWNYDNPYEAEKYEMTLELVREMPVTSALELACAEGHFSRRLAGAVGRLRSTDISENALSRAQKRCENLDNISFAQLDFFGKEIPGGHDLVVCSEVLYFAEDDNQLAHIAEKIAGAIAPDGALITAHANVVARNRDLSGFDWGDQFGVTQINAAFLATGKLVLERQIVTDLYRVSRFRRVEPGTKPINAVIETRERRAPLDIELQRFLIFGGAPVLRSDIADETRWRIPLISFPALEPPDRSTDFAAVESVGRHLNFLRRHGYSSISGTEIVDSRGGVEAAYGRAIAMLIDSVNLDMCEAEIIPIFEAHDFSAILGINAQTIINADVSTLEKMASLVQRKFELAVTIDDGFSMHPPEDHLRIMSTAKAILNKVTGGAYSIGNIDEWPLDPVAPDIFVAAGFDLIVGPAPGFIDLERDDWVLRRISIDAEDSIGMLSEKLRYDHEA